MRNIMVSMAVAVACIVAIILFKKGSKQSSKESGGGGGGSGESDQEERDAIAAVTLDSSASLIAQASASGIPQVVIGKTTYHVESIQKAADIQGVTVQDWVKAASGVVTPDYAASMGYGDLVYKPVASGVFEIALPAQAALRSQYEAQQGVKAPAGGVFQEGIRNGQTVILWQSDAAHPML